MTKELKTLDLNILPIETLKEMAHDKAELVEKNAKRTVTDAIDCGRYLTAIKEQMEHGEWLPWLGANWNYSRQMAVKYMSLANVNCGLHLEDASSVNEALRMIADSKPETAPRSERKPADVTITTPVDEPAEVDDDPAPDPPTNRKTAKGSEKVTEDKKPRTAAVVPEILPDEPEELNPIGKWLEESTAADVFGLWVSTSRHGADLKSTAKQLRKLADKLDPPTKFVKPDLDDVSAYMHTLGDAIGKDTSAAADGFIDHYQSNGWMVGKVAMKDWRATARKWLKNQGQFTNGSNGNGSAHRGTGKSKPTVEGVFGRRRVD